jgi:hypothetical protein
MDENRKLIKRIRVEFKIPSFVTDKEIMNSLDDMIYRNAIELEIALDEFKKEADRIHKETRYIYPPLSEMW